MTQTRPHIRLVCNLKASRVQRTHTIHQEAALRAHSTPRHYRLPLRPRPSYLIRHLSSTPPTIASTPIRASEVTMASDEDYMNFLNKANEDSSGGRAAAAQSSGQHKFKTTDSGKSVPQAIQKAIKDEVYVTDADEPFEGVALKWTGESGLPDEEEFVKLINHPNPSSADIDIMDPTDWDAKGQYGRIVEAVREASKGSDVRVYRVRKDGTRTEYWVVSAAEGGIVGAKALGVES